MPLSASSQKIYTLISSFIRQTSNVKDPETLLASLIKIVQKFVNCELIAILDSDFNLRISDGGEFAPDNELMEMIKWSTKTLSFTSIPEGSKIALIFPLVKVDRILGVLIAYTHEEPAFEVIDTIRTFAFLSATVLENLELYQSLEKQHEVVEETMRYMQQIFNSFPQMVVVLDSNLNPVFSNLQYIHHQKDSDLVKTIEKVASTVLTTKMRQIIEVELNESFYSIIAENVEYEDQPQVLITITDVTNTKELEKLRAADRLKTDFIATVSHELRTPLTAIKAYTETILADPESMDKDTLTGFLQIVYKESLHLESLLDELLDFAKLEQKAMVLEKSKFDLTELIMQVIQSMSEFARSKKVKLQCGKSKPIYIVADQKRIRQVLINLISNGIKYSKEEASEKYVRLSAETHQDSVIISVADNGIGIEKQHQNKIFEKFFRADSVFDYRTEGTGLGLAISKEIVELHGGQIWFESKPHEGTVFYVKIPQGE